MDEQALHSLAQNLWVVERPFQLRFIGADVGGRMTVVRLADGGLFLHSLVKLDQRLDQALREIGTVKAIVAPNRVHHLFVAEYMRAFPEARTYAAPGLQERRKDLKFDAVLGDVAPDAWQGQLEQLVFQGAPVLNEVVFFDAASKTVIFTDLVFNLPASARARAPFFFWLLDAPGKFGPHRLVRTRAIRDHTAARQSVARILRWDFDRVIMAHGDVLETGGRARVADAFAFLKR